MLGGPPRGPDRGKKRGEGKAGKGGAVFFGDPRKRIARFGRDADAESSSHRTVGASTRDRCRRGAVDAIQRHVLRRAMRGEGPGLDQLGYLGLRPAPGAGPAHHPEPPDGSSAARRSRPAGLPVSRDADSLSQALPSAAEGSIRSPTPASERINPEEWDDVLFPPQPDSLPHVAGAGSVHSSRVRSILSRCDQLKGEIARERRAASEAHSRVRDHARRCGIDGQSRSRHAASEPLATGAHGAVDADLLEALRLVAETKSRTGQEVKDRLRSNLRQLLPDTPKETRGNPGFQIVPGHNTRRHYGGQWQAHLGPGGQLIQPPPVDQPVGPESTRCP